MIDWTVLNSFRKLRSIFSFLPNWDFNQNPLYWLTFDFQRILNPQNHVKKCQKQNHSMHVIISCIIRTTIPSSNGKGKFNQCKWNWFWMNFQCITSTYCLFYIPTGLREDFEVHFNWFAISLFNIFEAPIQQPTIFSYLHSLFYSFSTE